MSLQLCGIKNIYYVCTVSLRRSTSCIIKKPIKADSGSVLWAFKFQFKIRGDSVSTGVEVIHPVFGYCGLESD